jgi:hypothetical protein
MELDVSMEGILIVKIMNYRKKNYIPIDIFFASHRPRSNLKTVGINPTTGKKQPIFTNIYQQITAKIESRLLGNVNISKDKFELYVETLSLHGFR